MTGAEGGRPGAPDRTVPVELLADLHAGVLDEQVAAQLRARVQADPDARAVLAALDATVSELGALPAPRIPADVAARIDAALAAEARRGRRGAWAAAAVLAVAAAVGALALSGGIEQQIGGTAVADSPPLALSGGDVGDGLAEALGARDYGPLSRPAALAACLQANRITPVGEPLGAREVTLDGRPGVLLVLPTGRIAQFRLLVVGPDCGPGNPSLIADDTVGR